MSYRPEDIYDTVAVLYPPGVVTSSQRSYGQGAGPLWNVAGGAQVFVVPSDLYPGRLAVCTYRHAHDIGSQVAAVIDPELVPLSTAGLLVANILTALTAPETPDDRT